MMYSLILISPNLVLRVSTVVDITEVSAMVAAAGVVVGVGALQNLQRSTAKGEWTDL